MNRISMKIWLWCMLSILTVGQARAQLRWAEFWVDDNMDNIHQSAISGSGGTLTATLKGDKLSLGLHSLCMRVQRDDGWYSPIYTTQFLKFNAEGADAVEYWFDDKVELRKEQLLGSISGDEVPLELELSDPEAFPMGLHQLNVRVKTSGGQYSPVYTTYLFKNPTAREAQIIEYWFDDNFESRRQQKASLLFGVANEVKLDLSELSIKDDAAYVAFSQGLHRLNFRVGYSSNQWSPVYRDWVMKLPKGKIDGVCYWIDDKYAGRRYLHGNILSGQAEIAAALDYWGASQGLHRLHFQVATERNLEMGVIYEVPILYSPHYGGDPSEATIVEGEYWVDDWEFGSSVVVPQTPPFTFQHEFTLYDSNYAIGDHTLYVRYKNSAGMMTATDVTYFHKDYSRLMLGHATALSDLRVIDEMMCCYRGGNVVVEADGSGLADRTMIFVFDAQGKLLAQQTVESTQSLHAEVPVEAHHGQILLVKVVSGESSKAFKLGI